MLIFTYDCSSQYTVYADFTSLKECEKDGVYIIIKKKKY